MSRDPIAQARRASYAVGRFLGDVQAARKGPAAVGRRVYRKVLWRTGAKLLRQLGRL